MQTPDFIKNMDLKKASTIIIIAVIVIVIWVLIEFGGDFQKAIQSVLVGLGLEKSQLQQGAETTIQANAQAAANPNSPWGPALYNNNPGASTLDYQTLVTMSNGIADTVNELLPNWVATPDANSAFSIIKQCNNQIDVSNLVIVFQQQENRDLLTFMNMNYTSAQNEVILQEIITFVNNLPAS